MCRYQEQYPDETRDVDSCEPSKSAPLYERLGGKDAVKAIVEDWLANALADTRTSPYFVNIDVVILRQQLVDQMCMLGGGPCSYGGKDMARVHAGMGITAPEPLRVAAERALNHLLMAEVEAPGLNVSVMRRLFDDVREGQVKLDAQVLAYAFQGKLEHLAERWHDEPWNLDVMRQLVDGVELTSALPFEVNLWQATNPDARDFRLETLGPKWTSSPLTVEKGECVARVSQPAKGYTAFMVELTYDGPDAKPLKLTTSVRVVPDKLNFRFVPNKLKASGG